MRDIKFRAFHKKENRMIYPASKRNDTCMVFEETGWFIVDHFTGKMETILKCEDGELMQYTGLKDKNGVEIYEGDIIKADNRITCIQWTGNGFNGVYMNDDLTWDDEWEDSISRYGKIELLGNIYQNPELLKRY